MNKTIIFLILTVFFLSFIYLYFNQNGFSSALSINYVGQGIETEEIEVFENGEIIFFISIDQLNSWMIDNWDRFEGKPEVGGRDVEPGSFNFFDQTALISKDSQKLIFTVHDYAVLTTLTFILSANLETGELEVINQPVRGNPEALVWSADSNYLASVFGTARSGGDLFYLFDFNDYKKVFELSEIDILNYFGEDFSDSLGSFMPRFRDIKWSNEIINFKTDNPTNLEEDLFWEIDKIGQNLELLD